MPASHEGMVGRGGERPLVARWVVCGRLTSEAALHLGGEAEATVDAPLLRDRVCGAPLLTGASLAGALRSHLADVLAGYRSSEAPEVAELFGGAKGDDQGAQSLLIVFDSRGTLPDGQAPEIRDGVAIDPATGTAEEHKKFDREVLPAGTGFTIRLDLLIPKGADETRLLALLLATLGGLEAGEVHLGARTSRGYGACRASEWTARRFDLTGEAGWLAWLATEPDAKAMPSAQPEGKAKASGLEEALRRAWPGAAALATMDDQRRLFRAELDLEWPRGGLLVRSPGSEPGDADATQLHSGGEAVLPGTSVAGALRARALRIARLACGPAANGRVEALFGPRPDESAAGSNRNQPLVASRLTVGESILNGELLQGVRIRVDRFTGGVVDGALFDEEPLYQGRSQLCMEIRDPQAGDVGLLLLLIKDLLTGDLPLGGTGSVGRGVTSGSATFTWLEPGQPARRVIWSPSTPVPAEDATVLNDEVAALHRDGETGA